MNPEASTTGRLRARSALSSAAVVAPAMMRRANQHLLLDLLYADGPATRPNLAAASGLSQPTILASLAGLVECGLVREAGRPETAIGRPAQRYEADPTAGTVAGIDIGRDWVRLALCDVSRTQLARDDARNTARSAAELVEIIGAASDALRESTGLTRTPTHTVIASPGVFHEDQRSLRYASNLPGWQEPGLADALRERIGGSIVIENDANLAAVAEHTRGSGTGTSHLAYLHVGTGLGLGIVVDGEIYRGASGAAGEVAYLPVGSELVDTDATAPRTRGLLEERAAADSVVRYAIAEGMPGDVTSVDVFEAARAGDPRATAAVRREAHHLATAVAGVAALLDPEVVVVGGGIGQNLDLLQPHIEERLTQITPLEVRLVAAVLGSESVLQGALDAAVRTGREMVFAERTATL